MLPRPLGWAAAAFALLALGCSDEAADDAALACSITTNWIMTRGEFQPQGQKSQRLSPEDRRLVNDSRAWRPLATPRNGKGPCQVRERSFEKLKVSRDGQWAVADFSDEWSTERCLARRRGERWVQRECDTVAHYEPVIPPVPEGGANAAARE